MAMAMAIPGSTRTPLGQLGMYLFFVATRNPNGDVEADARIASTLGVPPLPYTSNDTDAQTLLPAGWSWSADSDGVIVCVRASDGTTAGALIGDGACNLLLVPSPLARCIAAVEARRITAREEYLKGLAARD